jgi:hypothetical protein
MDVGSYSSRVRKNLLLGRSVTLQVTVQVYEAVRSIHRRMLLIAV